jgi:hypothetical protein
MGTHRSLMGALSTATSLGWGIRRRYQRMKSTPIRGKSICSRCPPPPLLSLFSSRHAFEVTVTGTCVKPYIKLAQCLQSPPVALTFIPRSGHLAQVGRNSIARPPPGHIRSLLSCDETHGALALVQYQPAWQPKSRPKPRQLADLKFLTKSHENPHTREWVSVPESLHKQIVEYY